MPQSSFWKLIGGLKEKESSSSHKHLDNCLLLHEKQLEVSGSWERGGEAAGAAGQRFVSSVEEGTGGGSGAPR